jgi:DNA-binding LacI/PurR family transcriptional regulator
MASWNVAGIIAVSSLSILLPQVKGQLIALGLPHSYTFGELEGPPLADYVTIDHEQGAYIAVSHLIDRGRTKIVYLSGPADRPVTRHRLDGYRRALADRNIDFDSRLVFFANDFFSQDADAIAGDILALSPRPDALFAASDALAAGLQRAYRRIGARMPDDIAMVGFNNDQLCESLDPALTSVSMPLRDVGNVVAKRMIARIESSEDWTPTTMALPCTLIVRRSS